MELCFGIVFFISAIYVFNDASKRKIPTALRWAVGTALIWIVVFPLYFILRKKLNSAENSNESEKNVWESGNKTPNKLACYAMLFVLSFAMYGINFYRGWLPSCDSTELRHVLSDLLDKAEFSNPAQNSYEKINEIRHCNITISDRIYSYTVTWYSEAKDRFIVKFDS